ncbi:HTH_Tnp_Tc3_2 domain-containing protein [Trichonephila clavipes]|nr:HTH_Tnp_Tc3_2 domain-containing protein [Trichonephila clavipes]
MGHSICEVAMKFGFSRTTISRVFREYRESSKSSNLRHHCGWKKIMQKRDQLRLTRIIKRDRRATLPQLAADFNAGPSTSLTLYASPGPVSIDNGLLMTGNMLPGLTSLVSNIIELMDVYEYGYILMNPWTLHVNRELFKLVEAL